MSAKSAPKAIAYPCPDTILCLDNSCFDGLDFTGFPEKHSYSKLDQIIPKHATHGKEDPPSQYRTSSKWVQEWRCFSRCDQRYIIDNPTAAPVTRGSSLRTTRQNRRREPPCEASYQINQIVAGAVLSPRAAR